MLASSGLGHTITLWWGCSLQAVMASSPRCCRRRSSAGLRPHTAAMGNGATSWAALEGVAAGVQEVPPPGLAGRSATECIRSGGLNLDPTSLKTAVIWSSWVTSQGRINVSDRKVPASSSTLSRGAPLVGECRRAPSRSAQAWAIARAVERLLATPVNQGRSLP